MKNKILNRLILIFVILSIIFNLVNCRKSRKIERAILLGYLLGSSTNNQQQTMPYPQYTMPVFLPVNHGFR